MGKYLEKYIGFTMAEAIVVMVILGIIATIMLTTMKPAKFKEEAMEILARQTLADLDTALTLVILNDCPSGNLNLCNNPIEGGTFSMSDNNRVASALGALIQKYMAVSRKQAKDWNGYYENGSDNKTKNPPDLFMLKNGVEIDVERNFTGSIKTWIPGEKQGKTVSFVEPHYGQIRIDINGYDEGPNVLGKDRFRIPLCKDGIVGGD